MPFEFVARNGVIALNNSVVSGSLTVTQGVTGSLFGTASWATQALTSSYVLNAVSSSFAATASSADNFTVRNTLNIGGLATISYNNPLLTISDSDTTTRFAGIQLGTNGGNWNISNNDSTSTTNNDLSFTRAIDGTDTRVKIARDTYTLSVYTGSNENVRLNANGVSYFNGGNVGIGTASPTSLLHVNGIAQFAASSGTIQIAAATPFFTGANISSGANTFGIGTTGANPIGLFTNNTERLRITSGGDVGIGTSSPSNARLVVSGTSSGTVGAIMSTDVGGTTSFVRMIGDVASQNLINWQDGTALRFATSNQDYSTFAERMRIFANGRVGINTTTDAGYQLDVNGTLRSVNGANFATTSGNVGIGTTSPNARLDINGNAIVTGSLTVTAGITGSLFGTSSWSSNSISASFAATASNVLGGAANYIPLWNTATSLSSSVIYQSAGNIGIGTISPAYKLDVNGITNVLAIYTGEIRPQSSSGIIYFKDNAGVNIGNIDGSTRNFQWTLGKFFVGTTTDAGAYALQVAGAGYFSGSLSTAGQLRLEQSAFGSIVVGSRSAQTDFQLYNTSNIFRIFNGSTDALAINTSGNVGIGTTSPSARLHVSGSTTTNLLVGTSDLFVSASGNVGIGTTSPSYKLDVNGTFRNNAFFTDSNSNTFWGNGTVATAYGLLTWDTGYAAIAATGGNTLRLGAAGRISNPDILISTSGNVGIGITSPSARLHVSGSTTTNLLVGTSDLFVSSSGNVGIGTTSPGARLDVFQTMQVSATTQTATIQTTNNAGILSLNSRPDISQHLIDASINPLGIRTTAAQPLFFSTNQIERMRITSGGDVGIGTTTPTVKLDVSSSAQHAMRIAGGDGNGLFTTYYNGTISTLFFGHGSTLATGATLNDGVIRYNGSNNLIISRDGTEAARFNSSGNLGIGTTSPNARLDVSGSAIVSGSFTVAPSNLVELQVASTGVKIGNAITDAHNVTGSLNVSGSTIVTGSLLVSQGVTSSLFGTASWANNAISSSFALSASWAPAGAAPTTVTFNRVTGSYTFVLSDAGKTVEVSGSTAISHSLTVPASSSVDFADGTYIDVILYGTGSILFVTASGVTIRSANNWNRIGTRYGAATLINIAGNEWYLIGNINP